MASSDEGTMGTPGLPKCRTRMVRVAGYRAFAFRLRHAGVRFTLASRAVTARTVVTDGPVPTGPSGPTRPIPHPGQSLQPP